MSKARELSELGSKISVDGSGNSTFDGDVSAANLSTTGNVTVTGTVDGRDVAADGSKLDGIAAGAEVNTVDSVNTQTGAVVLDADDISDAATTNKFTNASDISKLAGIEAGADVTDTANVTDAGALMTTGGTLTGPLVIDAAVPQIKLVENDTTNVNTKIRNSNGLFQIGTMNDNDSSLTTRLTVDHSNGRVGIGTTSPTTALDVNGTVTATSYSGDGSNLTGIQSSPYDTDTSSTGYFALPAGTTAQRPASPSAGWSRYNTTKSSFEYYNGTDWLASDQRPTITGLSGTVFKGSAANLTLTVAETTDLFSVRYLNGSTVVETVENQTQTNGSCTTAVPASVYNATGGTTFTVRLVNTNGIVSSTSQSFVLGEFPAGGTITTYGSYTVHKFTSSGTFTTGTFSGNVEYIVVAGGGGGGNRGSRWGGAGGAGGLRASISGVNSGGGASTESALSVSTGQSYTITIGGGGGPGAMSAGTGGQGGASSIGTAVTTVGGGGGGAYGGGNGGSGGGGSNGAGGGTGTAGQGYNGGGSTDQGYGGGGGGAAGAGGQNSRGAALSFTDKVQSGTVSLAQGGAMNTGAGAVNTGGGGDAGYSGGADSGGSGVVYIRYQL